MAIGILGGGLAGITIAAHLEQDYEILEKESRGGGHCQTVQEQGFTYDAGGPHIIFSRNRQMVDYMVSLLGANVHQARRNNKIFFKGRYVKYPFENGLFDLEPQDRFECLYHYIQNDYPPPKSNFKEWIYHHFGKGLAEKYLIPYNEKIWNVPAEELGLEWVEGRVPKPPVEDVIKAAVGVETEGYTHQLYYHYPLDGGIESLPRAMAANVHHIVPDFNVERIWKEGDRWCVSNGLFTRRYDALACTIPIQELAAALEGVPREILAAVNALRYNSLVTVSVGFDTARVPDYTAIYVPDPAIRFHRLSFPAAFSPHNAPAGRSIIQAEITTNPGDGTHEMPDEELLADVISDMQDLGLARASEVCYSRVLRTRYGYVVQNDACRRYLRQAKAYFEEIGIALCGRVAEFEYINMDVCIERAIQVAGRLNRRNAARAEQQEVSVQA
ncbi:MAG TPA: FAD-dependent oxidoreductase [Bryobacteraceae bacterium]|nr:FAD-dependent oxidoreductase [Bryobacteraceae bacterium]